MAALQPSKPQAEALAANPAARGDRGAGHPAVERRRRQHHPPGRPPRPRFGLRGHTARPARQDGSGRACVYRHQHTGHGMDRYDPDSGILLIHVLDLVDKDEWVALIKNRYEALLMEIFE